MITNFDSDEDLQLSVGDAFTGLTHDSVKIHLGRYYKAKRVQNWEGVIFN